MLVKVDSIHNTEKVINVTKLDIDDYGTMILLVELEFKLPLNDDHNRDRKKFSVRNIICTRRPRGE